MSIQEYQCPYCPDDNPFRAGSEREVRSHITKTDDVHHRDRDGFNPADCRVMAVHEDPMRNLDHDIQEGTLMWEFSSLRLKHPHIRPSAIADYLDTSTSTWHNTIGRSPAIERERERRLMQLLDESSSRAGRTLALYDTVERAILEYVDNNPDATPAEVRDALDLSKWSDAEVRGTVAEHTLPPKAPRDPELRDRLLYLIEKPADQSYADCAREHGIKPRTLQDFAGAWDYEQYDAEVLRGLQYPGDLGWHDDDEQAGAESAQEVADEPRPENGADIGTELPGTREAACDGAGAVATTPQTREAIETVQDDLDALSERLAGLEDQLDATAQGVAFLQERENEAVEDRLTDDEYARLVSIVSNEDPDLAPKVIRALR